MTAPLSYLLGDNPTNTHYCLLCAQEECEDLDMLHQSKNWMNNYCCKNCNGTGSKLVPIAEHPVDHEHVVATALMFAGCFIEPDLYSAKCEEFGIWLGGSPITENELLDYIQWATGDRPDDARVFIAQGYETQEERVKG